MIKRTAVCLHCNTRLHPRDLRDKDKPSPVEPEVAEMIKFALPGVEVAVGVCPHCYSTCVDDGGRYADPTARKELAERMNKIQTLLNEVERLAKEPDIALIKDPTEKTNAIIERLRLIER